MNMLSCLHLKLSGKTRLEIAGTSQRIHEQMYEFAYEKGYEIHSDYENADSKTFFLKIVFTLMLKLRSKLTNSPLGL